MKFGMHESILVNKASFWSSFSTSSFISCRPLRWEDARTSFTFS